MSQKETNSAMSYSEEIQERSRKGLRSVSLEKVTTPFLRFGTQSSHIEPISTNGQNWEKSRPV